MKNMNVSMLKRMAAQIKIIRIELENTELGNSALNEQRLRDVRVEASALISELKKKHIPKERRRT